jgi:tRNA threonylcarbamoyladenosine biosynthesis protein TsaE
MEYISKSLDDTRHIAEEVLKMLVPQEEATVLALQGDLGAGKTAFTKEIAKLLGITEQVTSPTFVIEKIYALKNQSYIHLIHIDAYRLESGKELETLGFATLIRDPRNLVIIEWPENVSQVLPAHTRRIKFTFIDEATRKIEL